MVALPSITRTALDRVASYMIVYGRLLKELQCLHVMQCNIIVPIYMYALNWNPQKKRKRKKRKKKEGTDALVIAYLLKMLQNFI